MDFNVKCFICGTSFKGETYVDACPRCDWIHTGEENETPMNEIDETNKISIEQAMSNYEKGLDIWGKPLKK